MDFFDNFLAIALLQAVRYLFKPHPQKPEITEYRLFT